MNSEILGEFNSDVFCHLALGSIQLDQHGPDARGAVEFSTIRFTGESDAPTVSISSPCPSVSLSRAVEVLHCCATRGSIMHVRGRRIY